MILSTQEPSAAAQSVAVCADVIRCGGIIGLPTETVYGLAADADNASAVAKVFSAKGRPVDHPLIVHVACLDAGLSGVAHFCTQVPVFAQQLMAAFWPGPLTLILPRREGVASAAAGGHSSVGLRCPSHPLAQALLLALRQPGSGSTAPVVWGIAAPSANRFGRVSPTTAAHVQNEFEGLANGLPILDGGPCSLGIESTIIDCTRSAPVLLRPGSITSAQVEAVCTHTLVSKDALEAQGQVSPRASGSLVSHYAPQAPVRLMDCAALQTALDTLQASASPIAVYARSPLRCTSSRVVLRRMPSSAAATAHELFALLHEFDAQGAALILVETPPSGAEWAGVRDRLQRASASEVSAAP